MSGGVSSGALREAGGGSGQPNGATTAPTGGASASGVVRAASGISKPEADVFYVNVDGDQMTGLLEAPAVEVAGLPVALDPAPDNALAWTAAGLYAPPAPAVEIPEEYATEDEVEALLAAYQPLAQRSQPDGYAPLDGAGLIPSAHLPPLAISETWVVASEAAMLALDAQVGDVAIRSDTDETYILGAIPASTLANWYLMGGTVTGVSSVNGEMGTVLLDHTDVGAAAGDHTHPSEETGRWRFQDTAGGTPGSGYLRTNSGALASASTLLLSRTTEDGYSIPPGSWGIDAGDTVFVQDRDDSTKWVRYVALEPLVNYPTYATGLVEVTGSAGSTIVNGQLVQVTFSLAGGGGGGAGEGVTSVNGETGAVVLDAADVGALTQTGADARYLQLAAGGTVTGATTLSGAVTLTNRPTVAGVAQPRVSVQETAPGSPATGDVWIW